ncbi:MAG: substrate-binding domain-containing protein [Treponema sp.]|nr:substrate-binding domain-containing protein [Treponema sp.]
MEKNTIRLIKWTCLIFSFIALLIFTIVFYTAIVLSRNKLQSQNDYNPDDTCLYHIIITGTYENQTFLRQLYNGASKLADSYNAVVELVVPKSQADTTSIQNLLDYGSFLNADGIIAYIDSQDEAPILLRRNDDPVIPLITTGQFSANLPQISFIGTNNWELGKKIADETLNFLPRGGNVFIISDSTAINSNNLISSLQLSLQEKSNIRSSVIGKLSNDFVMPKRSNVFICLTEDDTILAAQNLAERYSMEDYNLIGFGGNEVCQLYLQNGWISELVSLDPEKIGEVAIRELFEYRTKGYANSYVTADVKITRGNL